MSEPTDIDRLAVLLRRRNEIDADIATVIGRPASVGHLGEWIAARIFAIDLEPSARAKAIDGRFTLAPLAGKTVNVKCYPKREGLLDTHDDPSLDYYLVLTGPPSAAATSRGSTRPFCIGNVYLFDAARIRTDQAARGVRGTTVASVRAAQWDENEVYPGTGNPLLPVTEAQAVLLRAFAP